MAVACSQRPASPSRIRFAIRDQPVSDQLPDQDKGLSFFQARWNRSLRLPAVTELSETELDELVEQAIVDAYGDDEQTIGFYSMINDNLSLPFTTTVLGVEARVKRVDVTASGIVAICIRGSDRQAIPILDLVLPVPPPHGSEWIAAYRRWASGQ